MVDIRRVPELVSEGVAKANQYKVDQAVPIATVDVLPEYDAGIVGTGTRYGHITSQMANSWDQAGGLWFQGKLAAKAAEAGSRAMISMHSFYEWPIMSGGSYLTPAERNLTVP